MIGLRSVVPAALAAVVVLGSAHAQPPTAPLVWQPDEYEALSPREADARLDPLLQAWRRSDAAPSTLAAFHERFLLAERIKDVVELMCAPETPAPRREQAAPIMAFLEAAFAFHQRPVPDATSADTPIAVYATVDYGMWSRALGYARIPRDGPLEPLVALAGTDVAQALRCIARAEALGWISASDSQAQQKRWVDRSYGLRLKDAGAWLERATARDDEEDVYRQQATIAELYRARGDSAEAERWTRAGRPYLDRCTDRPVAADPVLAELQASQSLVDAPLIRERLQEIRARSGLSPTTRIAAEFTWFSFLVGQQAYAEAKPVGERLRSQVHDTVGVASESLLLKLLLSVERASGDVGGFEQTASEYERVRRGCAGSSWRGDMAYFLAEVAFSLGDYSAAEDHVKDWLDRRYLEVVRDSFASSHYLPYPPDDPDGLLLLASIYRERGRIEDAEHVLAELDARTWLPNEAAQHRAKLHAALGHHTQALAMAHQLRASLDQNGRLNNLDLWIRAALLEAQETLQTGGDSAELVRSFEQLAPHLSSYRDLGLQQGIDLYLFLASYHRHGQRPALAREWVAKALALAQEDAVGSRDQQIIATTLLGELAADAKDLATAIRYYRQALALLRQTSQEIRGDLDKVGYRAERARAVPLLVAALLGLQRRAPSAAISDEILTAIEEGKAHALTEMLFTSRGEVPAPDALRKQLPAGAAVLEYYIPPDGLGQPLRLLLDGAGVHIEALGGSAAEIDRAVRSLRDEVSNGREADVGRLRTDARALARRLLPSAWSTFERIPYRRLFIVPAGNLHLLPFSLLVDERGQYLDDAALDLAYLPNLSTLALGAPARPVPARAAAFLNPADDMDLHQWLTSDPARLERFTAAFRSWGGGKIAEEEPLGPDEFVRTAAGLDHAFVYAHASFRPDDPLASYVRLAGGPHARGELTARDLVRAKLGPGVWVFAACSTGVVSVRPGDEVLGLPRALLQAGARSVVISLWDVGSGTSLDLMSAFYEHMARGESVSRALRSASRALRSAGRSPFDWAAFLVVGQHDF